MPKLKALVIDDENLIRWSFQKHLNQKGYQVYLADSGEEGLKLFEKHLPEIIFLDNKLPGIQGLEVLEKIRSISDSCFVVFMTAYGTIETAIQAMKLGAFEYITKPFTFDEIDVLLTNIQKKIELDHEIQALKRQHPQNYTFNHFIGRSKAVKEILSFAKEIANSQASTVLLLGESGTGKDLLAKIIHGESPRREKPFVVINCSLLPETLLESELFGHEKGAFTDAKQKKKGLFEIADGGTIFLDEIGEINPSTQVKLLQFIENKTFRRVGGTEDIQVDVRIIAATNKNIEQAVQNRTFREDLYYRLKVFQITLPPLRERREDIPLLAEHFIRYFNYQFRKQIKGLTEEAAQILRNYHWPGNVRELRNIIERMVILEKEEYIGLENLPSELKRKAVISDPQVQCSVDAILEAEIPLEDIEKLIIQTALEKTQYNKSRAAKLLKISRDTLRYKVKKYNL